MSYDIKIEPAELTQPPWEGNITYNLGTMMRRSGVHPVVMDGMTALKARSVIGHAFNLVVENQDYFEQYVPDNRWGTVQTYIKFLAEMREYLSGCPDEYVVRWT